MVTKPTKEFIDATGRRTKLADWLGAVDELKERGLARQVEREGEGGPRIVGPALVVDRRRLADRRQRERHRAVHLGDHVQPVLRGDPTRAGAAGEEIGRADRVELEAARIRIGDDDLMERYGLFVLIAVVSLSLVLLVTAAGVGTSTQTVSVTISGGNTTFVNQGTINANTSS